MCASPLLAVDVGTTHVSCARFGRGKNGKLILEEFEREPLGFESVGDAAWVAAVEAALAAMAQRRNWRGEAHLAIPGHLALTRCATTPWVAPAKLGAVMAFEAANCIPYPLEQVAWDYTVNAERGDEIETLVMAAKAEPMRALCEAVTASGFELSRAVPASLALAHAFQLSYPDVHSATVIAVGARSTHVILLQGGRLLPRTLPLAGNTLTQAIAEALQVEFGRAEAIKLQHLRADFEPGNESARHAIVMQAARQFTERLRLEIGRSIANGREQTFQAEPQGVYLTGGGAAFDALAGWLQEQLALPVHRLDPLRSGTVVVRGGGPDGSRPDLADVVGLAASCGDAVSNGNLLPAKWRAAARFRRRQPVILAIAALMVAALLPPIWSYDREARNARTESAAIAGQLRSLQAKMDQQTAAVARLEETRRQLEALRRLEESKANWTGFFAELQQSLLQVEDVWLDGFEVAADKAAETSASEPVEGPSEPSMRLRLSGRMLDRRGVRTALANEAEMRVQRLLASVGRSRFVRTIKAERFDTSRPGILRFEFSVSVNPESLF
jgi:type IV pilus assembly protein PilM